MTLEEARANIGRQVVYLPFEGCHASDYEYGVITSVGDVFVFVRYSTNLHSKATRAEDLELSWSTGKESPDG